MPVEQAKEITPRPSAKVLKAQRDIIHELDHKTDFLNLSPRHRASIIEVGNSVCAYPDRLIFLRALLSSILLPPNNNRATFEFFSEISETNIFPFKGIKIDRIKISDFIRNNYNKPDPTTVICYFYVISVCLHFKHPCVEHYTAYSMIRLSDDLRRFAFFVDQGVEAAEIDKIIRLGEGLYRFFDYNQSVERHDNLSSTALLSNIESSYINNGVGSYCIIAIRASGSEAGYVVSNANVGLVSDRTFSHNDKRFLYTSTKSGGLVASRGFLLTNASGDLYFLQYQPGALGFNVTYIPHSELQMPSGFAKGIILTYDVISKLGGMASRIALFPSPKSQIPGGLMRSPAIKSYINANKDDIEFDFKILYKYLSNLGYIEISLQDRGDASIYTWEALSEYLNGQTKIDEGRISGYGPRAIRTG